MQERQTYVVTQITLHITQYYSVLCSMSVCVCVRCLNEEECVSVNITMTANNI